MKKKLIILTLILSACLIEASSKKGLKRRWSEESKSDASESLCESDPKFLDLILSGNFRKISTVESLEKGRVSKQKYRKNMPPYKKKELLRKRREKYRAKKDQIKLKNNIRMQKYRKQKN